MAITRTITLTRNAAGDVVDMKETSVDHSSMALAENYEILDGLRKVKVNDRQTVNIGLKEAFLTYPDAANILRTDVRYLAFSKFKEMPRTFEAFTSFTNSNKPQEEYLRDAAIGVIPKAPSGTEAPTLVSNFEGGTIIVNNFHRGRVPILGDWIRFDQIGKIRQLAIELGRAGRQTEEDEVYKYISTAANYNRNSTTNDNNIGANTAATTFDGLGLELAMNTISTSKDRKSGSYLGYKADTIIIGPRMEVPVKQLLLSGDLNRTHGATAAEVRGTGTVNQYKGMIDKIVISPWFSASYAWALCDSTVESFMYQTVEPFDVMQQDTNITSEDWMKLDTIWFLVKGYFGLGFVDDRAWYLSTSSTAPTVA